MKTAAPGQQERLDLSAFARIDGDAALRLLGSGRAGPRRCRNCAARCTLYALDAILRLHFTQEEEIYHGLSA